MSKYEPPICLDAVDLSDGDSFQLFARVDGPIPGARVAMFVGRVSFLLTPAAAREVARRLSDAATVAWGVAAPPPTTPDLAEGAKP